MDNFTLYTQHDSMQCGIACLAMICKHYGKEFSIETLSRYCFASTEGVCYREIIKKNGADKWYYPDVNCPFNK